LESAPALCAKFSYDLLVAISAQVPSLVHDPSSLLRAPGDDESSDDDDAFHPIQCASSYTPGPLVWYAGLGVRHMMRPSYIDDELAVADDAGEVTVVRELDRLPSVHLFSVLYICCCVHPT